MTLLHSVQYGSGSTTIVFLGSLGSTVDMWLPQLDTLSHDATVIALDHRGHGDVGFPARHGRPAQRST